MQPYMLPTLHDVDKAAQFVQHKIVKTPIKTSRWLDGIVNENAQEHTGSSKKSESMKLFIKCENLQKTGSFKVRGASHFLATLQDHELAKGIVAYSTGIFL
jgi:threonine dehydratase